MPKKKYPLGFRPPTPAGPTRRPMQKRIRETRAQIEKSTPASAKAKLAEMRPGAPSGGHKALGKKRAASRAVERKPWAQSVKPAPGARQDAQGQWWKKDENYNWVPVKPKGSASRPTGGGTRQPPFKKFTMR